MSTHQGQIDWKKVKADGIEFAILRSGYGSALSQEDVWFDRNYAGCKDIRMVCGSIATQAELMVLIQPLT